MTHPLKLRKAQIQSAYGKVFEAPGVINGSARVRFIGVWPSGNVAVMKETDPDSFGPLTVAPQKARPLLEAIGRRFAM